MEQSIPLSFVLWLLGFLVSLLGGCWAIFKYFDERLKKNSEEQDKKMSRIYSRLDENKAQYYAAFVSQSVYDAETRLRKENIDGRFERIVELFNEKIESLRNEIRGFIKTNGNGGSHG